MSTERTIAAISTGIMQSGISVIRISGKDSLKIVSKIFTSHKKIRPNSIVYGKIQDQQNTLDEVLVSYFKAPNSFTGEDTCEINCHGGKQITLQVLELVLKSGAVMAEPGEFSKWAFLNGKLDLSQAEAIIDVIDSKTKIQTQIAAKQLEGSISNKIKELRENLIEILAHIEVSIDYPEYDYEEVDNNHIINLLNGEIEELSKLVDNFDEGKYIKEGVNVAILGMPNMGKSSLLNTLAKTEKAIVTDIPGTTRDIIEETINIGNIVLNISDTAGIRDTDDIIEKIGVEKSINKIDEVDLVIYMLSADENMKKTDYEMLSKIKNKAIKLLVVINKMDKQEKTIFDTIMSELNNIGILDLVCISAIDENSVEILKKKFFNLLKLNDFDYTKELIIVNQRHKDLISKAKNELENVLEDVKNNTSVDITSISIKQAATYLGQIIGKDVSQDVVDKIFEKFCLGK